MSVERRIWEWMPKRKTRARVTLPSVAAANLDLPVREVAAAMRRMELAHQLVVDQYGNAYRGIEVES